MTRQFSKKVAIKATDDDEMTATGVVLTPNELDRQLDWLDEDGIRNFHAEDVNDGVMHAAFPEGDAELDRNEVLDAPETIDGVEFDAGEWVIRRRYHDAQRWQLVKSGALSSFSIGGTVERAEEVDSVADVPDEVAIPASVDPDAVPDQHWPPSKLIEGTVNEISDVDMGAVPSADHAVVKGLGKSPLDSVDSEEEFVAMMRQRGTMDDEQARETWRYMQDAEKAATGKQELSPEVAECKDSVLEDNPEMSESEAIAVCRAQMDAPTVNEPAESGADSPDKDAMSNSDTEDESTDEDTAKVDDVGEVDDKTLGARVKSALGLKTDAAADDAATAAEDADAGVEKVGRTLSQRNVALAKEMHDDAEEMLRDAGVDSHSPMARTYHEDKHDDYERGAHAEYENKGVAAKELTGADIEQVMGVVGGVYAADARDAILEGLQAEGIVDEDDYPTAAGIVDNVIDARNEMVRDRLEGDDTEQADEQKANDAGGNSGVDLGDLDPDRVNKIAERADQINT